MVLNSKARFFIGKGMERAFIFIIIRMFIVVTGRKINLMELVLTSSPAANDMLENSSKALNMVKENISMVMEMNIKGIG